MMTPIKVRIATALMLTLVGGGAVAAVVDMPDSAALPPDGDF